MMKAIKVLRAIRQKEQDNDEVKFSDYDIMNALNEALRYLNISLVNKGSEHLQGYQDYDQDKMNQDIAAENEANIDTPDYEEKPLLDFAKTGAPLPDDYISLINVQRTSDYYPMKPATSLYEIQSALGNNKYLAFGDKLYTPAKVFRLTYNKSIEAVKDFETDTIDLPDIFFDPIVKVSRLVLNNGDADTMTQAVTEAVNRVLPRRRYTNAREIMPFDL